MREPENQALTCSVLLDGKAFERAEPAERDDVPAAI